MSVMKRAIKRLHIFFIRIRSVFYGVRTIGGLWIALATLFNYANLNLKRRFGIYFPFSLGIPTDELMDPIGKESLKMIENVIKPLHVKGIVKDMHINVIIPTLNPTLIFGGYIGLFNFIEALMKENCKFRLLISDDFAPDIETIENRMSKNHVVTKVTRRCELVACHDRKKKYSFGKEDIFVGYSWTTMRLAYHAASSLNGKRPIFFIQEYEPIFYHYDSLRFFADETYRFPHHAVFNSNQLRDYFENNNIGVFNESNGGKSFAFRQAIADIQHPELEELKKRDKKRLIVYARPEKHAGRNLFAVSIYIIKEAIRRGFLKPDQWDFFGIGSLGKHNYLELINGHAIKLLPRMSYQEYTKALQDYDLGISLMYSPHPSVPPLEMAAAGMSVVTTSFENRPPSEMEQISGNIFAAEHSIESLMAAFQKAIDRVDDFQGRIDGASINWPRSWSESFDEQFRKAFRDMISLSS